MISQKMQNLFNGQIQAELSSSYLYLAMAAHCDQHAYKGFGRWLKAQADEERSHAVKFIEHLVDRGGHFTPLPLEAPPSEYSSILNVFEKTLDHERQVTTRVHNLFETAQSEKDYASQTFMQWFVTEQVEEEARAGEIVDKLRLIGDKSSAALYLDKEYGKRGKE